MTATKQRIEWLDIAKGIACLTVIIGHTISYDSPFRQLIFSFHMPLFFILSGYTFRIKPWRELLHSSVRRLVIPYLCIYFIYHITMSLVTSDRISLTWAYQNIMTFLFASGTTVLPFGFAAVGMPWFLVSLFFCKLIFNAILRFGESHSDSRISTGLISAILALSGYIVGAVLHFYLPFSLDISFVAVLFMWFGYIARTKELFFVDQSPRRFWFTFLVVISIWLVSARFSYLELAARRYDSVLLTLIAALSGTLMVCMLSSLVSKIKQSSFLGLFRVFLNFVGRNSMSIFCTHSMDYVIPWASLAAVRSLPFPNGITSCVRILYNTVFAKLILALK